MPEKSIENTRRKLARLYGIGILVFVAVFGFLTLLALFQANHHRHAAADGGHNDLEMRRLEASLANSSLVLPQEHRQANNL